MGSAPWKHTAHHCMKLYVIYIYTTIYNQLWTPFGCDNFAYNIVQINVYERVLRQLVVYSRRTKEKRFDIRGQLDQVRDKSIIMDF